MIGVYKDGELIAEFDTLVEALEFANADAEVCGHDGIEWEEIGTPPA